MINISITLDENTLNVLRDLIQVLTNKPQPPVSASVEPVEQPVSPVQQLPANPAIAQFIGQQPEQAPVPTQAPTTTVTYDIQKLAVAAMQLKDAGRLNEIQELIAKYNIASIMELKPEQFESFAQDLIAKGVKF